MPTALLYARKVDSAAPSASLLLSSSALARGCSEPSWKPFLGPGGWLHPSGMLPGLWGARALC